MGQIVQIKADFNGKSSNGEAHLESDFLTFRGDFKFKIPFKEISSLKAIGGQLAITFPKGKVIFYLGDKAQQWAEKIKNPKSLIDKLGVKPDSKVVIVGVTDNEFLKQLKKRTKMATNKLAKEMDFIFYSAESLKDLAKLSQLKTYLKKNGAIWVVSLKGKEANIRDTDVMKAAKEQGLVDVKVVSFSTTHTANKLVIPTAKR
jgi:hypothetical protein